MRCGSSPSAAGTRTRCWSSRGALASLSGPGCHHRQVSQIRSFADSDLPALVDLSLRAWTPVFSSLRQVLGDEIFLRLHPNWEAGQAEAVRAACTSSDLEMYVAIVSDQPVGFVAVALNAYHERMGAIEIIAVDPNTSTQASGEP